MAARARHADELPTVSIASPTVRRPRRLRVKDIVATLFAAGAVASIYLARSEAQRSIEELAAVQARHEVALRDAEARRLEETAALTAAVAERSRAIEAAERRAVDVKTDLESKIAAERRARDEGVKAKADADAALRSARREHNDARTQLVSCTAQREADREHAFETQEAFKIELDDCRAAYDKASACEGEAAAKDAALAEAVAARPSCRRPGWTTDYASASSEEDPPSQATRPLRSATRRRRASREPSPTPTRRARRRSIETPRRHFRAIFCAAWSPPLSSRVERVDLPRRRAVAELAMLRRASEEEVATPAGPPQGFIVEELRAARLAASVEDRQNTDRVVETAAEGTTTTTTETTTHAAPSKDETFVVIADDATAAAAPAAPGGGSSSEEASSSAIEPFVENRPPEEDPGVVVAAAAEDPAASGALLEETAADVPTADLPAAHDAAEAALPPGEALHERRGDAAATELLRQIGAGEAGDPVAIPLEEIPPPVDEATFADVADPDVDRPPDQP